VVDPHPDNLSWSTIARAASGEVEARSAFGHTYLPVVRCFLEARWRATPLAPELDDAVQEVFVECLRRDGVLSRAAQERGDLRGLLFGVSRNVAARFEERAAKRLRRDQAAGSAIDGIPARDPSLSIVFDREWARTLMRLAGERMQAAAAHGSAGARLRVELLELRFAQGRPIRAIAREWDVDADSVHRAYARAREEFRLCLRRVLAEHTVRTEVDLDAEVGRLFELLE
jgi:DNA-directed RNA polymerase specialized sigma24 family protein